MSAPRYFKRCGCRTEDGRQLKTCPKLHQRTHGTWAARVELPRHGGRRNVKERSGFRTRGDAEQWATGLLKAIEKGARNLDPRMTTGQWLERWLAEKTNPTGLTGFGKPARPSTAASYRLHVGYLTEQLGDVPLIDLTPEDIRDAYRAILDASEARAARIDRDHRIRNEGRVRRGQEPLPFAPAKRIGPTTLERIHACLRAALSAAEATGRLPANPSRGVTPGLVSGRRERPAIARWTTEQLGQFLQAARTHRLGIVFELLAASGLRRGEALGLAWGDVDLNLGVIHVHRQLLNTWTDGAPTFGPPKSAAGVRTVALPQSTVDALRLHRLGQDTERDEAGEQWQDHGLALCQANGRPYDPSMVSKTFTRLVAAEGLPAVPLHDLRHQAATRWLANRVPLVTVSKRLGHSSIAITADTYAHRDDDADRSAAEAGWIGTLEPAT